MILRLDGQIYYANALTVRDHMKGMLAEAESPPRAIIFDASAQDQLDLTSANTLSSLFKELREKGIDIYVADAHAPVLEFGRKMGLLGMIGEDHVFATVDLAVKHIEAG